MGRGKGFGGDMKSQEAPGATHSQDRRAPCRRGPPTKEHPTHTNLHPQHTYAHTGEWGESQVSLRAGRRCWEYAGRGDHGRTQWEGGWPRSCHWQEIIPICKLRLPKEAQLMVPSHPPVPGRIHQTAESPVVFLSLRSLPP